jgi:tRNA nucleotidyltransferase (CCA-adding enzyme)
MRDRSSSFAEVRFIDRDRVIEELRRAAAEARNRYPEISRVLLFGSLVRGDWTADSDADLIVVVKREFSGLLERSPYQIFTSAIPTDTLVYSEAEFERLVADRQNPLSEELRCAVTLLHRNG